MNFPIPKLEGFMIYNTKTGLFERKGFNGWGKQGNIWRTLPHLKNHLQMKGVGTRYNPLTNKINGERHKIVVSSLYDDCIVLDVSTQAEVPNFKIKDYLIEVANRKWNELGRYQANYEVEIAKPETRISSEES